MTGSPRVTVVIPTYNRAALVVEAIGSVLAQSFTNHEIVVCDDGSTDDTRTRVQSFGSAVRYLRIDHTGRPGPPRNRGMEAARGELIAFLDDDDLWHPDKLVRQVTILEQEPTVGLVYTDRRIQHADGSHSTAMTPPSLPSGELLDLLLAGDFPCICTVLVRRDVLRRTGGFDEALDFAGEELDLWFRLARITRARRVPEPLTVIRRMAPNRHDPIGPFRHAIRVFERQLDAADLRLAQRLRCHATLSQLNTKLHAALAATGDGRGARRAALRALRHRPVSPRVWARAVRVALRRA